jgi:hypothetical protein
VEEVGGEPQQPLERDDVLEGRDAAQQRDGGDALNMAKATASVGTRLKMVT